jgi:cytochrome c-type biogenesis protein CcmH
MSGSDLFWFCAGALLATGFAFVVPPLWRGLAGTRPLARYGTVAAVAFSITVLSLWLYATLGSPPASKAARSAPHASLMTSSAQRSNQSLQQATAALAARLESVGGSDAEWELLAQSYEYAGDTAAATQAREHRAGTNAVRADSPSRETDESSYRTLVERNPADGQAWLGLAQIARTERRFEAAKTAYDKAIALQVMNADSWADYADVLAAVSGSLRGPPSEAIGKALATNPEHSKALWLHASLAVEERRYSDALAAWKRLRAVIPEGSPDARIVDANIAEAAALARGDAPKAISARQVAIRGQIELDQSLVSRVSEDMTLFVYAKAVDSPGPPVAVLRTRAPVWPVSFQLDDSLAMMPGRVLSGFDTVIVEARLSKSGDALAKPGDLQASSTVVKTRGTQQLKLRLSKVIG